MSTTMDKQQANEIISNKLAQIQELMEECEKIADQANISFTANVGGYGMGGWYESGEWSASSSSC